MPNDNSWTKQTSVEIHIVGANKNGDNVAHPELSIPFCEQALAESRKTGDRQAEGDRLLDLARAYLFGGQIEQVLKYYEQALIIFQEIGDRASEAKVFDLIGSMYGDILAQDEVAIMHHGQALNILRETGDRPGEGNCLLKIGMAYFFLHQVQKAFEFHEKALAIFREVGDRKLEAVALGNIARDYFYLQQIMQGNQCYEQALTIFQEIKDNENILGVLANMAYFCLGQKHFDQAIAYYTQALAIAREINDQSNEAMILEALAFAYFESYQGEKSVEIEEAAVQIYETLGNNPLADKARKKLAYFREKTSKKWWQFWL
jgi:tetratricopeptide (TPR) repeat protein